VKNVKKRLTLFRVCTFAPALISSRTISAWPFCDAITSAVFPFCELTNILVNFLPPLPYTSEELPRTLLHSASIPTLAFTNKLATPVWPPDAASMSAVHPFCKNMNKHEREQTWASFWGLLLYTLTNNCWR
jgi:hypothetical protein